MQSGGPRVPRGHESREIDKHAIQHRDCAVEHDVIPYKRERVIELRLVQLQFGSECLEPGFAR
jgi:hypothetical protein